ncbi:hypothetical protein, partial [Klebsiella pneumoniae]|uniref:hypothetical protein n=1 Tax=Klebsiella pneumoniae TaxID=573 RepID=UPI002731A4AF
HGHGGVHRHLHCVHHVRNSVIDRKWLSSGADSKDAGRRRKTATEQQDWMLGGKLRRTKQRDLM